MTQQLNIDEGRDRLIDILHQEGKYVQFLRYQKKGQIDKMQKMVEEVLDRRRSELDKVMKKF